jgi:type II secretory ATPase GspE/PulE/Tfp pilus assembly ATPase PilB-like protein
MVEQTISYADMTRRLNKKRLGDLLLEQKMITESQLEKALEVQHREGGLLGEVLVKQGLIKHDTIVELLSSQLNVPIINLKGRIIDEEVLALIPEKIAKERNIIPVEISDNKLVIAMGRPEDLVTIDDINLVTGLKICVAISNPSDIEEAISSNYKTSNELDIKTGEFESIIDRDEDENEEDIDFSPAVQNLNKIINQAIHDGASDIHMEPYKKKLRIRFRIDGVLQDKYALPVSVNENFISRLKILGKMNIAEVRRPQDGQFTIKSGKNYVDIRVATVGTAHGERATLRILDKSLNLITLEKLGFLPDTLEQLNKMLKTSFGMILVGGPTGSGKTTTLYSMINTLDRNELNVMTIEDPIEYNFADITQMQINERAGISFSTCLKASMRHDPDVILVGEIRDPDTARIAVQAAMTGHLVLASIHASDVSSMIFRLIHLGIEPYLISSTLIGLLAQRLVRCICQYCHKTTKLTTEEAKAYQDIMGEKLNSASGAEGCSLCSQTGYRGRTGIFELLSMNDTIRSMMMTGSGSSEIRQEAMNNEMITMAQAGMTKVKQGTSTMKDVLRAIHTI